MGMAHEGGACVWRGLVCVSYRWGSECLIYLTKDHTRDPINLLLITKVEYGKILSHYCWIKDFNRLCFDQNKHRGKTFFCTRCISGHCSERTLQDHMIYCRGVDTPPCHAVFPQATEDGSPPTIQFKNIQHLMKAPYVIYADTEAIIKPTASSTTDSNTVQTSEHIPCSFAYTVVRSDGRVMSEKLYRGEDCMDVLFNCLEQELENIREDLKNERPLAMTQQDWAIHSAADKCWVCDGPFKPYEQGDTEGVWKVRDHDHLTGKYRGPAHSKCNLSLRIDPFHTPVPILFHNLKNYDAHHLISAIGRTEVKETVCTDKNGQPRTYKDKKGVEKKQTVTDGKISAIVQNMEKVISFSWGQFRFVDSYAFLSSSLGQLVANTPKANLRITRSYIEQAKFNLITRKGVFPYEYMDSFDRFEETQLPPKENFYSSLTDESISDSDYQHAQEVWTTFNCATLGSYHDLYLKTDVLLLADVFENFRKTALSTYKLDPAHYYTLPGYSWDALLKLTNVSLELLTEPDIYLFVEKGLRGGISMVSHRHAQANNPQMQNYNPDQPTSFLQYLDANSLYAWAMSEPMPMGGFQWVSQVLSYIAVMLVDGFWNVFCVESLTLLHLLFLQVDPSNETTEAVLSTSKDADQGFILEVDLDYPPELHKDHNDYPLAPEKMKVTNTMMSPYQQKLIEELGTSFECKKLVPNLMDKSRYVLHYRNLQL